MNDFLGMGQIIKEQRERIARLELENRLLRDAVKGDDTDLKQFNKSLTAALVERELKHWPTPRAGKIISG